jgi:undecaprenyl-diphosphatase
MSGQMTYPESIVIGALQGITELFPVSSLGHSVLIPALIGGSWARDLDVSSAESPYLAFIVGLHVATALALVLFFWRDWVRIVTGLITSIRYRRVSNADERLAWMLVIATIPVGISGLVLEHAFRTVFGRPVPAAIFLIINGGVLYGAERLRRRAAVRTVSPVPAMVTGAEASLVSADSAGSVGAAAVAPGSVGAGLRAPESVAAGSAGAVAAGPAGAVVVSPAGAVAGGSAGAASAGPADSGSVGSGSVGNGGGMGGRGAVSAAVASDRRIAARRIGETTLIGSAQVLALFAGISRSGVTMAAGLLKGLSHEDAARFSFLLATPVILAAGLLKVPDLFGPLGQGIHGQVLVGSICSFVGAYLSVRFLTRYFETRTLTPFAIYCAVAGLGSLIYLGLR